MERRTSVAIIVIFVAPIVVGVAVNLLTPWLQTNAGTVGVVLTSSWLPWFLYLVTGALWFFYWFGIIARRPIPPYERSRRINACLVERNALMWALLPMTDQTMPLAIQKRLKAYVKEGGRAIGDGDPLYARFANTATFLANGSPDVWRGMTLSFLGETEVVLLEAQHLLGLSPAGPQSPRTSKGGRSDPQP